MSYSHAPSFCQSVLEDGSYFCAGLSLGIWSYTLRSKGRHDSGQFFLNLRFRQNSTLNLLDNKQLLESQGISSSFCVLLDTSLSAIIISIKVDSRSEEGLLERALPLFLSQLNELIQYF